MKDMDAIHGDVAVVVEDAADDNTHEASPLLPTDIPPEVVPGKSFRIKFQILAVMVLVTIDFCQYLLEPAMQAVMEDLICREQYPDHFLRQPHSPSVLDLRCKAPKVQKELAMIRSWSAAADMLVPLLVQVAYGIIADKYGRSIVIFLSILGIALNISWNVVVVSFPETFSLWAVMFGSLAYLIGGGGQLFLAIMYTAIADIYPLAERTSVFYQFTGFFLCLHIIMTPVGAALLAVDAWLPIWLGLGSIALGACIAFFWPETLQFRKEADAKKRAERRTASSHAESGEVAAAEPPKGLLARAWFGIRDDVGHVWHFIFASETIMLLLMGYAFWVPYRFNLIRNILQYMTERFGWAWSTAAFVSTFGSATNAVILLVFLPLGSAFLTRRYNLTVLRRDLLLARVSIVFVVMGSLLAAFAGTPELFITSLVISCGGAGFGPLMRALLNALVEPHTIAVLNTTLSTLESMMMFLSSPALGWLLGKGMELGGLWSGMVFLCATGCTALSMVALLLFRIPSVMDI